MPDGSPETLRLLSWNVASLRAGPEPCGAVIRAAEVDVAALEEAPRFARWRSKRAALAREAGMVVATADRVGGVYLVTSIRAEVGEPRHIVLPRTSGLHQRALVGVTVSIARGKPWEVFVTRLGLDAGERERHARSILAQLPAAERLVLAADMNEAPDGAAWQALGAALTDAGAQRPSPDPGRRDAVFLAGGIQVMSYDVLDDPAARACSDHLPIVVTVSSTPSSTSGS